MNGINRSRLEPSPDRCPVAIPPLLQPGIRLTSTSSTTKRCRVTSASGKPKNALPMASHIGNHTGTHSGKHTGKHSIPTSKSPNKAHGQSPTYGQTRHLEGLANTVCKHTGKIDLASEAHLVAKIRISKACWQGILVSKSTSTPTSKLASKLASKKLANKNGKTYWQRTLARHTCKIMLANILQSALAKHTGKQSTLASKAHLHVKHIVKAFWQSMLARHATSKTN